MKHRWHTWLRAALMLLLLLLGPAACAQAEPLHFEPSSLSVGVEEGATFVLKDGIDEVRLADYDYEIQGDGDVFALENSEAPLYLVIGLRDGAGFIQVTVDGEPVRLAITVGDGEPGGGDEPGGDEPPTIRFDDPDPLALTYAVVGQDRATRYVTMDGGIIVPTAVVAEREGVLDIDVDPVTGYIGIRAVGTGETRLTASYVVGEDTIHTEPVLISVSAPGRIKLSAVDDIRLALGEHTSFSVTDGDGNAVAGALLDAGGLADALEGGDHRWTLTGTVAGTAALRVSLPGTSLSASGPGLTVFDPEICDGVSLYLGSVRPENRIDSRTSTFALMTTEALNTHTILSMLTPDSCLARRPENQLVAWETSNRNVIEILRPETKQQLTNNVTFICRAEGTATLSMALRDGSGIRREIEIRVEKRAPEALVVSGDEQAPEAFQMVPGQRRALGVVTWPEGVSNVKLKYKSSNSGVASVNSAGVVRAIKKGNATITVSAKGYQGSLKFKVRVRNDYSDVQYRALLVHAPEEGNSQQVEALGDVLGQANYGGNAAEVQTRQLTSTTTLDDLDSWLQPYAAAADDDDVFVFYFCGSVVNEKIRFAMVDSTNQYLSMDELALKLSRIRGTIVVLMDCDMGSLLVTDKGFERSVAQAFARQGLGAKTVSGAVGLGSCRFRVLTATSRKAQAANSRSATTQPERLFTRGIIAALQKMRADTNKNKLVTLNELRKYVSKRMKADVKAYNKRKPKAERIRQTIGCWPAKDTFPVYARRPQ